MNEQDTRELYPNSVAIIRHGELMTMARDGTISYRFETSPDDSNHMVLVMSVSDDVVLSETIRRKSKITVTIEY